VKFDLMMRRGYLWCPSTGSFAVWGTMFSVCDCSITKMRQKEDPWNAIVSGAVTGGILAARAGWKAAGRNALAGGVILAAIEGLSVVMSRVLMPMLEKQQQAADMPVDLLDPPVDPLRPYVKSTPLWTPMKEMQQSISYSPPALTTPSQGIDIDSISEFDPNAHDDWEHRQKQKKAEEEARGASKPAWKLW
jgi:hypothetical protein